MKYGVIDIGSNSVRLMINKDGKTLYKSVKTTRLSEGMGELKILQPEAALRTVHAVSFFVEQAKVEMAEKIYIFATAAVRRASNPELFLSAVKDACGIDVDVVSGETEAMLGRIGALGSSDGGVIDVGGASTEVIVVKDDKVLYSKSVDVGAVRIKDSCGQDKVLSQNYIDKFLEQFGDVPITNFYSIGGTATSIAAIMQCLEPYDPEKTNGFYITLEDLDKLTNKLYSMSVDDRKKLKGLQPERAEVIAGSALLLLKLMRKIGVNQVAVSESDNLEGYLFVKTENL